MLKYILVDNPLTKDRTDDYSAQPVVSKTYGRDEIIDLMLRKGTLVTKTDAVAVMNNLEEVIVDIIKEGSTVNLPVFNTSFSISGVFDGPMDAFDPSRHKLNVNLTKGTLLRDAEKEVRLTKTEGIAPAPTIVEIKDVVSGSINDVLTPGGVIQLWGSGLKIDRTEEGAEAIGLWFVPESGAPVKSEVLVVNKPSTLIAMVPALAAGKYTIKVVTQYTGGALVKSPRSSAFDKIFTIS